VKQRSTTWCPSFTVEGVSGEELYWLAKLCEQSHEKALLAVERYLARDELAHEPDAHLLLATLQMRTTGGWEAAWGTIVTILQKDPIEPVQAQIDVAIDNEANTDPAKALEWSKTRFALLLSRRHSKDPNVPPVSFGCVLSAGSDLVHRYYLAGERGQAVKALDEMNNLAKSESEQIVGWGAEDLHWANMEMHAAPHVPILKILGRSSPSALIQPGRVEVISFFFLGCSPCLQELPYLDALQKRYGEKKLLVTDVTSYKANSHLTPSAHSNIETSLEKARLEKAPGISFVITSDETLASYDVNAFPVVAIVDKMGRLRYIGHEIDFQDDDPVGELIKKLTEE
jgi:thiol-disulfide isomerase/thioredoxin